MPNTSSCITNEREKKNQTRKGKVQASQKENIDRYAVQVNFHFSGRKFSGYFTIIANPWLFHSLIASHA
jgi:hypothetical protein